MSKSLANSQPDEAMPAEAGGPVRSTASGQPGFETAGTGTVEGHADRALFIKPIPYSCSVTLEPRGGSSPSAATSSGRGTALGLNLGPGGMLLLMNERVARDQVLRIQVPTGVPSLSTPTLVDVRWTTAVPIERDRPSYLVGVRFLL